MQISSRQCDYHIPEKSANGRFEHKTNLFIASPRKHVQYLNKWAILSLESDVNPFPCSQFSYISVN